MRFALSRRGGSLAGRRVVVTAGGTRETFDPVRNITHRSSGRMGHALARAALYREADVVLVSSAIHLACRVGAEFIRMNDVASLRSAVPAAAPLGADVLIMAPAVSDLRSRRVAAEKLEKGAGGLTVDAGAGARAKLHSRGP